MTEGENASLRNIEQRLDKLEDAHLVQKLAAIEKLEDARWTAHTEVHRMGQLALDEAVKNVNFRLGTMNELREQYDEERVEFVRSPIFDREFKILEGKLESGIEKHSSRISLLEQNQSNQAGRTAAYVSMAGGIFVLVQVLLHFWK
jgi:hypothetical protein